MLARAPTVASLRILRRTSVLDFDDASPLASEQGNPQRPAQSVGMERASRGISQRDSFRRQRHQLHLFVQDDPAHRVELADPWCAL